MTFEKDTLSRITELKSQLAGSPNMPAGQRIDTENRTNPSAGRCAGSGGGITRN